MPNNYESTIVEDPQIPKKCIVHREKIDKLQHDFDILANSNAQKSVEVEKLCNKIEETIQKLNELTLSITKVFALHDIRLQNIEKCEDAIHAMANIQTDKFILNDMQTNKNKESIELISKHFTNLETAYNDRFDKIDKRIGVIEVWRWMVVGAILISVWLISQLPHIMNKVSS